MGATKNTNGGVRIAFTSTSKASCRGGGKFLNVKSEAPGSVRIERFVPKHPSSRSSREVVLAKYSPGGDNY
jgi:hypothetical protein